jgi:hypothetical protein
MGDVELVGQSSVHHGGDPKGGVAYPLSGAPHCVGEDQYPWPICEGEECQKAVLDTAMGEDSRSLDL